MLAQRMPYNKIILCQIDREQHWTTQCFNPSHRFEFLFVASAGNAIHHQVVSLFYFLKRKKQFEDNVLQYYTVTVMDGIAINFSSIFCNMIPNISTNISLNMYATTVQINQISIFLAGII